MKKNTYGKTKAACYIGYVIQAVVNNFLPILFVILQDRYRLSYEALGRIILFNFCTQIIADLSAPLIVRFFGYKKTAVLAQGIASAGLLLLSVLPEVLPSAYTGIVVSVIVSAFGSGLIEVILSPLLELLPSDNKSGSMAVLHSFYSWGQAFAVIGTTVLVALFGGGLWRFIPLVWAVIPLFNTFFFLGVPVIEPPAEEKSGSLKGIAGTRPFIGFVIFMLCAGASEIAMAEWASMFAQRGLGVNKIMGDLLGPCAFAVCMGIGRVIFAALSGKFSVRRVLICNNLLCCVCYLAAAFCKNPVIVLCGCALCGFSVSLSWPGTYSLGAARFPNGGTVMFSVFALCGDVGCSLGPWLLGLIADHGGLELGFAISTVFPLLMLLTALFVVKEKDCKFH